MVWQEECSRGEVQPVPESQEYLGPESSLSFSEILCDLLDGHSFITTRNKGFMCIGHGTVFLQDEIWWLYGASVPVLLRPAGTTSSCSEGERLFTFVCPVYVHSAMNGEPLLMAEKKDDEESSAILRQMMGDENISTGDNYDHDFLLEDLFLT